MLKLFEAYAERIGLVYLKLRFILKGQRIIPEETPRSLGLEENDQIDAILYQVGC
jgi:small ubiquitin-related modifier